MYSIHGHHSNQHRYPVVDVLMTKKWSPQQALLSVENDEPAVCAIIYRKKGSDEPLVTASTMTPMELYFFGGALQAYAFSQMRSDS